MKKLINKAFYSEINVNKEYKSIFNQFFGNRRFIYNQALSIIEKILDKEYPIKSYYKDGKEISLSNKKNFQFIGTMLNDKYDFLSFSHSQSNQEAIHSLYKSWKNYKDPKMKNMKKPNFKKKSSSYQSFYLPNQNNITIFSNSNANSNEIFIKPFETFLKRNLKNNYSNLDVNNKLSSISRISIKNKIPKDLSSTSSTITGITISKENNRYFISINYKYEIDIFQLQSKHLIDYITNKSTKIIGIDLGLKDKIILSDGTKISGINNSISFKNLELLKKQKQRKLSKIVNSRKKKLLDNKRSTSFFNNNKQEFIDVKKKITSSNYNSINKQDLKKLLKSKKVDKYISIPKKIDLYQLFLDNKLKILEKDYQLSRNEWKKIYNNDKIKKLKKDVNAITRKIANKVKNENHHISKNIVNQFDFIFMEDLTLLGMQKLWGNKIKNLSLSQLVNMVKYKAENQGKVFTKINKFFIFFFTILNEDLILQKKDVEPSSKTCSSCNNKYNILLSQRIFSCPHCNTSLDRDINAAINILFEGINIELAKIESNPLANSSGDLKDYKYNYRISKVVDGISYGFKKTSPFMVG